MEIRALDTNPAFNYPMLADQDLSSEISTPAGATAISSVERYQHIFEGQDVEIIIQQVMEKDRDTQYRRKVTYFDIRWNDQKAHAVQSENKATEYKKITSLILASFGVVCAVAGGFATGMGAPISAGVLNGGHSGFEASRGYRDNVMHANISQIDHRYTVLGQVVGEESQSMRDLDQKHDQSLSTLERLAQAAQRLAEMISGR